MLGGLSANGRPAHLGRLVIRSFRNLSNQELELPAEGVALIGDNAQGKSNFLEAIYYLETLRSFRKARDEHLIRLGADVFRVVGMVAPGSERPTEIAAAYERGGRKKVTVDGAEPERMGDALGQLAAVIFSPADVELVAGAPSERRRFLDIVLSLSVPGYLSALQDYRRILVSRNASLKEAQPASVVRAWDPGLVESGTTVVEARRAWTERWCGAFRDYYGRMADGASATMTYQPSVSLDGSTSREGVAEAFGAALAESADRERRFRTTQVGPHRDDLRLRVDEGEGALDLRRYGSGGQRRTAALALRLVEAKTIRAAREQEPMILLDDIFAELDVSRGERVLDLIEREETGQVVLTVPKESDVRIRRDSLPRWWIHAGRIDT